jgi:molybdate transport system permease protein
MATKAVLFALVGAIILLLIADLAYTDRKSFSEVLWSAEFRSAFALSLGSSFLTTVLALLVAIPAAYALSRFPFRGALVLDVFVDFLIVMPVLVIGVSLLVFFRMGTDLAESSSWIARDLGTGIAWLGGFFIYQKAGIVLAQFFCSVSFAVRALKAAFSTINPRTEQVAMTLGCTPSQAFWRITLPMARHGILAAAVLSWSRAFEIFGAVAIVAGAVRRRTEVLPTAIYLEFSIGRIEAALVISLVMIAVAFLVLLAMRLISSSDIFGGGARP